MLGGATRHMLPHLPGVPHLHVNRLDAMVDAIYRRNARVIEMQNFTPAYMKGGTYVRTIFSEPKFRGFFLPMVLRCARERSPL